MLGVMQSSKLGASLMLLAVLLAGCGSISRSPAYSTQDVQTAFERVGIAVHLTQALPGYPLTGALKNAKLLTGGIRGNPSADIIIYVFEPGNEAKGFYSQQHKNYLHDELHSVLSLARNVVISGDNLSSNDQGKLRAAARHLLALPPK
jgi:hypothetical protein